MSDKDEESEDDLPPLPNSADLFRQHLEKALQNDSMNFNSDDSKHNAEGNSDRNTAYVRFSQKSFVNRKGAFDDYISNPEDPCPLSYNELVNLIKKEKHPVIMPLLLQVILNFLETNRYDSDYQQLMIEIFGSFKSLRNLEHLIPVLFFFVEKGNPASVIQRTYRIYEKEKNKKLKIYLLSFWKLVLEEYGIRVYSNVLEDVIKLCRRDYDVMFLRKDAKALVLAIHRYCALKMGQKIEKLFPELKTDFENQSSQPVAKGRKEDMNLSISAVTRKKKKKKKKMKKKLKKKKRKKSSTTSNTRPFSGRGVKEPLKMNRSSMNPTHLIPPPPPPPPVVRIGTFNSSNTLETTKIKPFELTTTSSISHTITKPPPPPRTSSIKTSFTPLDLVTTKKESPELTKIESSIRDSKSWKEKVECLEKLEKFIIEGNQKQQQLDPSTISRIQKMIISTLDECKVVASQLGCLRCLSLLPSWQKEGSTPHLVILLNRYREKNKRVVESLTKTIMGLSIRVTHKLFKSLVGKVLWRDSPDILFHFLGFIRPKLREAKKLSYEVHDFLNRESITTHSESRIREISASILEEIGRTFPPPPKKRESFMRFESQEEMRESANRLSQKIDRKKSLSSSTSSISRNRLSSISEERKSLGLSRRSGPSSGRKSIRESKKVSVSSSEPSPEIPTTIRKSRVRFSIPLDEEEEEDEDRRESSLSSSSVSSSVSPSSTAIRTQEEKGKSEPTAKKRRSILKKSSRSGETKKDNNEKQKKETPLPVVFIKKERDGPIKREEGESTTTTTTSSSSVGMGGGDHHHHHHQEGNNTFEYLSHVKTRFLEQCLSAKASAISSLLLPYFETRGGSLTAANGKDVLFKDFCFLMSELETRKLFEKMAVCLMKLKEEDLMKEHSDMNLIIQKVSNQTSPTKCLSSLLGLLENRDGIVLSEGARGIYTILILKTVREYKKMEERRRSVRVSSQNSSIPAPPPSSSSSIRTTTSLDVGLILTKLNNLLMMDMESRSNQKGQMGDQSSLGNVYLMRIIKTVITQFVRVLGSEIYDHVYLTPQRRLGIMKCIDIVFEEVYGKEEEYNHEQMTHQKRIRSKKNDFEDLKSLENLERIHQDHCQKYGDFLDEDEEEEDEEDFESLIAKFDSLCEKDRLNSNYSV